MFVCFFPCSCVVPDFKPQNWAFRCRRTCKCELCWNSVPRVKLWWHMYAALTRRWLSFQALHAYTYCTRCPAVIDSQEQLIVCMWVLLLSQSLLSFSLSLSPITLFSTSSFTHPISLSLSFSITLEQSLSLSSPSTKNYSSLFPSASTSSASLRNNAAN